MRLLCYFFLIFALASTASAQFHDNDGQLRATWASPDWGNPVDHYIWSYTVNGVADSVTGSSAAIDTVESSVTLDNLGDWAVFHIRAVSVLSDTSVEVVSDTAYFSLGTGIGPPRGVTWIQGP
jgi:hypothetical protein